MFTEAFSEACDRRIEETGSRWYRKEIAKLVAIVEQKNDSIVSREYIAEKLKRILSRIGIGIHPSLYSDVEFILNKSYCVFCGVKMIKCKTQDGKSTYYDHPIPYCERIQIMRSNTTSGGSD